MRRLLLLASALTLLLSPVIARDVKCDRRVENGHTLQRCEFIETPQAAAPPPAPQPASPAPPETHQVQQPPMPTAPPQHTCFATGRLGIFSESADSVVVGAVDPNQPVTVLGVSPARDWVLIGTGGQRGWVDARYVTCP
jgi:Bacterial SH3 domain